MRLISIGGFWCGKLRGIGDSGKRSCVNCRLWELHSMQSHLVESSERKLSIFQGKVIAVTLFLWSAVFSPEVESCKLLLADFILHFRQENDRVPMVLQSVSFIQIITFVKE